MGLHRFYIAGVGALGTGEGHCPPAMDPQPSAGPPLRQKHPNGVLNGNKGNSHWILRKLPKGEAGEAWEVGDSPSVSAKYVLGGKVRLNLTSVEGGGPCSHGSAPPQGAHQDCSHSHGKG